MYVVCAVCVCMCVFSPKLSIISMYNCATENVRYHDEITVTHVHVGSSKDIIQGLERFDKAERLYHNKQQPDDDDISKNIVSQ